jgi:hypothetical protein
LSKQFTRKIFVWLRQIKDDHALSPSAARVALQMIEHFNEREGGKAWAGERGLADAIGTSKSTVQRVIHRLEARGHLRVEWGKQGRGHSNRYWMQLKGPPTDLLDDGKGPPAGLLRARKGPSVKIKGPPVDQNHLTRRTTLLERESKGTLSLSKKSPGNKSNSRHQTKPREPDGFAEWWANYPRRAARPRAKTAYRLALRRGATPAELLNGVLRYAAEQMNEPARFTMKPANWLKDECWKDEPAPPRSQRGSFFTNYLRENADE